MSTPDHPKYHLGLIPDLNVTIRTLFEHGLVGNEIKAMICFADERPRVRQVLKQQMVQKLKTLFPLPLRRTIVWVNRDKTMPCISVPKSWAEGIPPEYKEDFDKLAKYTGTKRGLAWWVDTDYGQPKKFRFRLSEEDLLTRRVHLDTLFDELSQKYPPDPVYHHRRPKEASIYAFQCQLKEIKQEMAEAKEGDGSRPWLIHRRVIAKQGLEMAKRLLPDP